MIDIWAFDLDQTSVAAALSESHARRILARYAGVPPAVLSLDRDALGKPRLHPSLGLHFNLSHCGDRGLLAVRRGGPVGVDLERWDRIKRPRALLERIASPGEGMAPGDMDAQRVAAAMWSRKEAALKALGTGLRCPMRRVRMRPLDAGVHVWLVDDEELGVVVDLAAPPPFVAAVAYVADPSGALEHVCPRGGDRADAEHGDPAEGAWL